MDNPQPPYRKIIHLDLDAFYCAVEELLDPSLKGKPFAVGGSPTGRGVVTSCSYPARAFGVHSAMPMARAVQVCKELVIVRGSRDEYSRRSRQVMKVLRQATPLVEQISIDEAFLDVTDNEKLASAVAKELQARILDETGLPNSLGVATNKLIAKVASDVGKKAGDGKDYPNAIQVVPPGREAEFLAPLPTKALWGVGPKTAARLAELGIRTIGDIASWPQDDLRRRFGQHGGDLARRAKGIDTRPVSTSRETKSVSQEITFREDISDETELKQALRKQAERVAKALAYKDLKGKTVKIKLRWPDFTTLTRQTTLAAPTDEAEIIYKTGLQLMNANRKPGQAVRLIGVGVSNLEKPGKQLTLWDVAEYKKEAQLEIAVKEIQKKFGEDAIKQGKE
ncbi:MAG: DNA polymerase IV [Chloroflexi bacterium]|nr:MAG: DNA polymerase IV [Chloroflexota bacterium]MBL1193749.1 DNA polymerase IV [Chloroflexota bacterium]NOH11042.1 DNA polymerase IV [Chloroflexota bacterium]